MKTVLLTGVAGFIAARTGELLLKQGYHVVGLDNMNDYYDVRLKNYRLARLKEHRLFTFYHADIEDRDALVRIFKKHRFDAVLNLAARAGVRYSLENPYVYLNTNANGALNLLEQCRVQRVKKFVQASTSSLYAGQTRPFKESLSVNTPISPYSASKKTAEDIAYVYHYHYGIDITVLRYFTVYGPAGRPDMSVFRFIKWVAEDTPIRLFGDGSQSRDFTYIDDIARGTVLALKKTGFKIFNLGGHAPYNINHLIRLIEKRLGKKAMIKRCAFQKVDMKDTQADINEARKTLRWSPEISLDEGIRRTVKWYLENQTWLAKVKV